MKVLLCSLIAFLCVVNAFAANVSTTKEEFCSDRKDHNYFKELLEDDNNRLSFSNRGGLLNGGVCWWHSRFQRNSIYLTMYNPDLPTPTDKEAKKIISNIRKGKKIVIIPGFDNFNDFSRKYYSLIQKELEKWQRRDGFIRQSWITGLSGNYEVSADELANKMDNLYDYVVENTNIAYQKLQLEGIEAHAWLVIDMKKTYNGYKLIVVDSNYLNARTHEYTYGDTYFEYGLSWKFVPYTEQKKELKRLKKVIKKYCANVL